MIDIMASGEQSTVFRIRDIPHGRRQLVIMRPAAENKGIYPAESITLYGKDIDTLYNLLLAVIRKEKRENDQRQTV